MSSAVQWPCIHIFCCCCIYDDFALEYSWKKRPNTIEYANCWISRFVQSWQVDIAIRRQSRLNSNGCSIRPTGNNTSSNSSTCSGNLSNCNTKISSTKTNSNNNNSTTTCWAVRCRLLSKIGRQRWTVAIMHTETFKPRTVVGRTFA